MKTLHIIGLGQEEGDLSVRAEKALKKCDTLILKTAREKSSKYVLKNFENVITLDSIFDAAEDFDQLNLMLADEVLRKCGEETAYCVPYSPETDDSVNILTKKTTAILYPSSGHTAVLSKSPHCDYTAVSAYHLEDKDTFEFNRNAPLIIYDIDSKLLAGEVKLFLGGVVGDEADCLFFSKDFKQIKAYEIDMQEDYGYMTEVMVCPEKLTEKHLYSYGELVKILKTLRAPNGCPWDRAQTHESIKSNLIEEAYELVEAIEENDDMKMLEESGDVLLQAVFHAAIASENGEFTFAEMLQNLCNKLVFRHSHIFGEDRAESESGALDVWEKNKRIEKNQETLFETLESVPRQFPSLMRLYKVLKKVNKAGLSRDYDIESLMQKFQEQENIDNFFCLLEAEVSKLAKNSCEIEVEIGRKIDSLINEFMSK